LFPVDFSDGARWLLKVPINGTPEHWDETSASALISEALTMKLIRRRTSVPLPEVFDFCASLNNPLHCPYIWLSFISGISLYDLWYDKPPAISEDEHHRRRIRALEDIAIAMVQLDQFSFPLGGRILFNDNGKPIGIGPAREADLKAMSDRRMEDIPDYMPVYVERGPFKTAREFYSRFIRGDDSLSPFLLGQKRLLTVFIDCIVDFFRHDEKSFVLVHPDFGLQNCIVSPGGELLGIIDWDGVAAWPSSLGNQRYPGWLTRDWDPGMYGYGSDGVLRHPDMREDSPEVLAKYRKVYRNTMRRILTDVQVEEDVGVAAAEAETETYATSATLITENIDIAARGIGAGNILNKIVKKVVALVGVPGDLDPEMPYTDLCRKGGEDLLKEETRIAFRTGFQMLLGDKTL
jgi:hypothetical protein